MIVVSDTSPIESFLPKKIGSDGFVQPYFYLKKVVLPDFQ